MKRQYEGYLAEEIFGGIFAVMLNFTYGGKARLESLFEEFVDGKIYRITIEEIRDRKELKPLYSMVSAPITAEGELVPQC